MSSVWVLTVWYNDYDQHGGYFVAWWPDYPQLGDLLNLGIDQDTAVHILEKGGGRRGFEYEYQWYDLLDATAGKDYHDEQE